MRRRPARTPPSGLAGTGGRGLCRSSGRSRRQQPPGREGHGQDRTPGGEPRTEAAAPELRMGARRGVAD